MAASIEQVNMTEGALLPKVLRFSLPLAATGVLQLLFNAADVVVVGRFAGSTALAAVVAPPWASGSHRWKGNMALLTPSPATSSPTATVSGSV